MTIQNMRDKINKKKRLISTIKGDFILIRLMYMANFTKTNILSATKNTYQLFSAFFRNKQVTCSSLQYFALEDNHLE